MEKAEQPNAGSHLRPQAFVLHMVTELATQQKQIPKDVFIPVFCDLYSQACYKE